MINNKNNKQLTDIFKKAQKLKKKKVKGITQHYKVDRLIDNTKKG